MSRILDMAKPAPDRRAAAPRDVAPLGLDIVARLAAIDQDRLTRGRLERLRAELRRRDYAGALLSDPMNIRYATGTRNMAVWTLHAPGRYAFVATEGPVVLFEFNATRHVSRGTRDGRRDAACDALVLFPAGPRVEEKAALWADEVATSWPGTAATTAGSRSTAASPGAPQRLQRCGIALFDAQEPLEQARMIKTPEEIKCMQLSMDVCDIAVDRMRERRYARHDREPGLGDPARDQHRA